MEAEKLIYNTFIQDVIPRWQQLESHLTTGKLDEVRRVVHSSKPSFTFAGLGAMVPQVEAFQKILDSEPQPEYPLLMDHYKSIQAELENILPEIQNEILRIQQAATGDAVVGRQDR